MHNFRTEKFRATSENFQINVQYFEAYKIKNLTVKIFIAGKVTKNNQLKIIIMLSGTHNGQGVRLPRSWDRV